MLCVGAACHPPKKSDRQASPILHSAQFQPANRQNEHTVVQWPSSQHKSTQVVADGCQHLVSGQDTLLVCKSVLFWFGFCRLSDVRVCHAHLRTSEIASFTWQAPHRYVRSSCQGSGNATAMRSEAFAGIIRLYGTFMRASSAVVGEREHQRKASARGSSSSPPRRGPQPQQALQAKTMSSEKMAEAVAGTKFRAAH